MRFGLRPVLVGLLWALVAGGLWLGVGVGNAPGQVGEKALGTEWEKFVPDQTARSLISGKARKVTVRRPGKVTALRPAWGLGVPPSPPSLISYFGWIPDDRSLSRRDREDLEFMDLEAHMIRFLEEFDLNVDLGRNSSRVIYGASVREGLRLFGLDRTIKDRE